MDPRELKRRVVKWCDVGRCPLDARSNMIDHYDGKRAGTVFRDIDDDEDDEDDDGDWHCTSVCFHGPFPPVALATKSGPIHTHNLTFADDDNNKDDNDD